MRKRRDEEYEKIPGVVAAMPVGDYTARIPSGPTTRSWAFSYQRVDENAVRLLAIDRLKFPQIAYFRTDYASRPIGELMNRLGEQMNGVLVSSRFAQERQISRGDLIRLSVNIDREVSRLFEFVVVGTFDYFPTMFEDQAPLLVANLQYLQMETASMFDFGIWMQLAQGTSSADVLEQLHQRTEISTKYIRDLRTVLAEDGDKLERVGIFGMLSVCFLAGALLAAMSLFVQSAASMRGRSLRFAILQAIGVGRGSLIAGLSIEYLMTLLYSVLAGLALGIVSARLYVPFFQLTDKAEIPVPPYLPLIDWQRSLWMAATLAIALLLVEAAVVIGLSRSRLFETLRLGARE